MSINQLLLRKTTERGQFWGALRQIDEMRAGAVESLQERITRMRHEIQRNIVSEQIYQRYDTVEEIHLRLSREDREFEELQAFVRGDSSA